MLWSRRPPPSCVHLPAPPVASQTLEELSIDLDVVDGPRRRRHTDSVLPYQLDQFITVDQVKRGCAVTCGLSLCVRRERASRDQESLVTSPDHRAPEIADFA